MARGRGCGARGGERAVFFLVFCSLPDEESTRCGGGWRGGRVAPRRQTPNRAARVCAARRPTPCARLAAAAVARSRCPRRPPPTRRPHQPPRRHPHPTWTACARCGACPPSHAGGARRPSRRSRVPLTASADDGGVHVLCATGGGGGTPCGGAPPTGSGAVHAPRVPRPSTLPCGPFPRGGAVAGRQSTRPSATGSGVTPGGAGPGPGQACLAIRGGRRGHRPPRGATRGRSPTACGGGGATLGRSRLSDAPCSCGWRLRALCACRAGGQGGGAGLEGLAMVARRGDAWSVHPARCLRGVCRGVQSRGQHSQRAGCRRARTARPNRGGEQTSHPEAGVASCSRASGHAAAPASPTTLRHAPAAAGAVSVFREGNREGAQESGGRWPDQALGVPGLSASIGAVSS